MAIWQATRASGRHWMSRAQTDQSNLACQRILRIAAPCLDAVWRMLRSAASDADVAELTISLRRCAAPQLRTPQQARHTHRQRRQEEGSRLMWRGDQASRPSTFASTSTAVHCPATTPSSRPSTRRSACSPAPKMWQSAWPAALIGAAGFGRRRTRCTTAGGRLHSAPRLLLRHLVVCFVWGRSVMRRLQEELQPCEHLPMGSRCCSSPT